MVNKNPNITPSGPTPIADEFEILVDDAVNTAAEGRDVSPQSLSSSIQAISNAAYDAIVRLEEQLRDLQAGRHSLK